MRVVTPSVIAAAALTLYPDRAPSAAVTCAAELPRLSPTAVESTANILLLLPLAFPIGLWQLRCRVDR